MSVGPLKEMDRSVIVLVDCGSDTHAVSHQRDQLPSPVLGQEEGLLAPGLTVRVSGH